MSPRRSAYHFALLALALTLASCARATLPSLVRTGDARIDAYLARLRTAIRPFQVLDSAVAAGYPREVAQCLVHEHHGAMGYHHVNRRLLTAKPAYMVSRTDLRGKRSRKVSRSIPL